MKANLLAAAVLAAGTLAACSGPRVIPPPQSSDVPARPQQPGPAPASPRPAPSWIDNLATPGDWRWSQEGGQSIARFAAGRLTLRCDPAARAIRIERSETAMPPAGTAGMTIRTQAQSQGQTRALTAMVQSGTASASLPANDPLLDAMAFSKGRFAVEMAGLPPLYVPSWTEVSRVVEDCR